MFSQVSKHISTSKDKFKSKLKQKLYSFSVEKEHWGYIHVSFRTRTLCWSSRFVCNRYNTEPRSLRTSNSVSRIQAQSGSQGGSHLWISISLLSSVFRWYDGVGGAWIQSLLPERQASPAPVDYDPTHLAFNVYSRLLRQSLFNNFWYVYLSL